MRTLGKFLRGYWLIPLLAAVLLVLAVFAARFDTSELETIAFQISGEGGTREISAWKNEEDVYYVFLPSYCSLSDVHFRIKTASDVMLDGIRIQTGQSLEGFELGREYRMQTPMTEQKLCFLQSANVSTLYIDTASGSLKAIHTDKGNSEEASVTLVTADGTLDYSGTDCSIKGRGNATWFYEKKPYNLIFKQETDLLGMGKATKWVLLANATDETNLRNKVALDLGRQTMPLATPECEYVDVYLNGDYSGLYLLAERAEAGESRLDIAGDTESFLCKLEPIERQLQQDNPFVTDAGRLVEIVSPNDVSSAAKTEIARQVQLLEDTILQQGELSGVLDVDSWVRRFLIDETLENLDGDTASSYFYCTGGVFYAGPLWDYDHILGTRDRNLNPEALLAANLHKSPKMTILYANALYDNPVFYERMVQTYEAEFLPLLEELAETGLTDMAETISAATRMNSVRWRSMFDSWERPVEDVQNLIVYLKTRIAFLNSAWIDGVDYCAVQVQIGTEVNNLNYLNYTVPRGEVFRELSAITVPGIAEPQWVNADTGEVFDASQPITQDIRLDLHDDIPATNPVKDRLLIVGYLGLILLGITGAAWFDLRGRRGKRRRTS